MADPQKYYRLKSLADRGFYVPDVIPFEEVATQNQLMLLKNINNQQSDAMNTPKRRKPGQKISKGPGRPQSLAYQELVPEEAAGAPGSYMQEAQFDNLARKGVR
jgi:hypothetical protein